MAAKGLAPLGGAAGDLGLGSMLQGQTADEVEEEKRRRQLGMSPLAQNSAAAQSIFGFGKTGIAAVQGLGLNGRGY